mmetsp:Transcript_1714/g.2258  ORF Transcript_1714/g.2258 Transcript_1714/m.2258 type:complete len:367 (-) Transcript_1714:259-1359(-)
MAIFDRFRRTKTPQPTEEQVNAQLNVEGDAAAKLQAPPDASSSAPQWSSYNQEQQQKQRSSSDPEGGRNSQNSNRNDDYEDGEYNLMVDGKPVYIVKQQRGYLSILFSLSQTIILIAMMIQCGVAPMQINPMIGPYPDALSYWGGKNAFLILHDNEYWRLVTPIMLHAGVFHLLCNVAVQLDTGAFWEREWGSFTWLIIYIVSAVWGSILSVITIPNSVGVGSSGSVCGLFGAKMAEAFCRMCESKKSPQNQLSHDILCEQFGTTLCSVILILAFSFIPYVDWAAHVGGLIGGFAVGLLLFSLKIKTRRWKIMWFLTGFFLTVIGAALGIVFMLKEIKDNVADEMGDVCGYYKQYFEDYECNCQLE